MILDILNNLKKAISMCSCPYLYIITYLKRYEEWNEKRNAMDTEEMEEKELLESDDDEEDDNDRGISFGSLLI